MQGMIATAVDERKITSALVVLRQNGTALIAVYADVQLQAKGTWSDECLLARRDSSEDYWWRP
jgi:hypothetical protein